MATHKWTQEEARAAGIRSAQLRAERAAERKRNPPLPIPVSVQPVAPTRDPYIDELMRAQVVTLDDYLACPIPKDRASLAQALKNLRETYHLATGLAKPGVRKPERTSTRQQPGQQSSGPELPPDAPTGSGSPT